MPDERPWSALRSELPSPLRAVVASARLDEPDAAAVEALRARLEPLLPSSPWRLTARVIGRSLHFDS